jgi:DNA-binding Lrp family transcriptional regulator
MNTHTDKSTFFSRQMNLDDIDTRLYRELQRDGRASMEELAGVVGLSRVAVRARVARLIDSGALRIVGVVHPSAQELRAFAHLSIAVSGSALSVGQAIATLDRVPLVSVVAGRAALIAEVRATNIDALRSLIHDVADTDNVIHVEAAVYTERIKDLNAPPGTIPPTEIDEVDRQVLSALENDGRASYADIARMTQYSASAIRARVNYLMNRGVVRISAVVTPGMVGLQHMCGFGLRFSGGTEHDAIATIVDMSSVSYLSLTLGRWDAIGTLLVPSQVDVVAELDRIRSMSGIEGLESWTHLHVIKENYQLAVTESSAPE